MDDEAVAWQTQFETTGRAWIGGAKASGPFVKLRANAESRGAMTPAPLIGQHTNEILLDVLRLPSAEVGRLHDDGIVAGPEKDPTAAGSTRR